MITTCSYLLRFQLQSLNPVFQILRPLSKQTLDSRTRTADCVTVAVTCELPKSSIVVELLLRLWQWHRRSVATSKPVSTFRPRRFHIQHQAGRWCIAFLKTSLDRWHLLVWFIEACEASFLTVQNQEGKYKCTFLAKYIKYWHTFSREPARTVF
jgi:hypothetical protein